MGSPPDGSGFDGKAGEIQNRIIQQEQALYSEVVIEEYHHPKNMGRMYQPDAVGVVHGWCGDTMELCLRISGGRIIVDATFMTDGCGPTIACGSKITTMIRGMSVGKASGLTKEDLLAALDGLPEENLHCAELAVNTLQEAVGDAPP